MKGRVIKRWTEVQVKSQDKESLVPYIWRRRLARTILLWYYGRWKVRCDLAAHEKDTEEHARVLGECQEMWVRRKQIRLLLYDRYLYDERHEPNRVHSLKYLEE